MNKPLVAVLLAGLLGACSQASDDGNAALAQANASGSAASASLDNKAATSEAAPLPKEQALALMKARHSSYEQIGKAMRAAKKGLDSNDLPAIRAAAATIDELAPKAQSWFPQGTGPDVGKTMAKAEIWKQPEQFALGMKDFREAATAFREAAAGDDFAAIKTAHANLGKTCQSCHERFREEHHR